jgi:hypothetical protein
MKHLRFSEDALAIQIVPPEEVEHVYYTQSQISCLQKHVHKVRTVLILFFIIFLTRILLIAVFHCSYKLETEPISLARNLMQKISERTKLEFISGSNSPLLIKSESRQKKPFWC